MIKKKIDALGRIGIPKGLREAMELCPNDSLFLSYDSERKQLVLKKANETCAICNQAKEPLFVQNGIPLCKNCLQKLNV
ncbi:MAG: AbrB/MazE/SpoVT family DNA-binding domain-containing protein [Clostridia bacterium]|nr:AbrB/MazE/SpoVT family DNA-binding domain-containing protein [Clostridia bacterium]